MHCIHQPWWLGRLGETGRERSKFPCRQASKKRKILRWLFEKDILHRWPKNPYNWWNILCGHDVLSRLMVYSMIKWSIIEPWSHVFSFCCFLRILIAIQIELRYQYRVPHLQDEHGDLFVVLWWLVFSRNNDPGSLEDWIFEEIQQASLNGTHLWQNRSWCKCMAILWDFPYNSASCCVCVI